MLSTTAIHTIKGYNVTSSAYKNGFGFILSLTVSFLVSIMTTCFILQRRAFLRIVELMERRFPDRVRFNPPPRGMAG